MGYILLITLALIAGFIVGMYSNNHQHPTYGGIRYTALRDHELITIAYSDKELKQHVQYAKAELLRRGFVIK